MAVAYNPFDYKQMRHQDEMKYQKEKQRQMMNAYSGNFATNTANLWSNSSMTDTTITFGLDTTGTTTVRQGQPVSQKVKKVAKKLTNLAWLDQEIDRMRFAIT